MAFFAFRRKKTLGRIKNRHEVSFARQFFRGVFRIVLLGCFLALTWYGTRLQMFTIHEVQVEGGETISHDEIRARVTDELQGAYFLVIPKRFSYLYPHDRILEVLEKIPRAHNLIVERASRNTLAISFDEYIPHALWCIDSGENTPCMFVDSRGYAFAPAPQLDGGTLVRHVIEGSESLEEGAVISEDKLFALDTFLERTRDELGLRITTLTHKKNGDVEFFVNGGGSIRVSGGKDFQTTFENLKSVLTSKEFQHIGPGNFQYIDVRFDNKVFVNEELKVDESTSTASTTLSE